MNSSLDRPCCLARASNVAPAACMTSIRSSFQSPCSLTKRIRAVPDSRSEAISMTAVSPETRISLTSTAATLFLPTQPRSNACSSTLRPFIRRSSSVGTRSRSTSACIRLIVDSFSSSALVAYSARSRMRP